MKTCPLCKCGEVKKEKRPMTVGSQTIETEQYVCQNPSCKESFVDAETSTQIDVTLVTEAKKRWKELNHKKERLGLTDKELEEWSLLSLKKNHFNRGF